MGGTEIIGGEPPRPETEGADRVEAGGKRTWPDLDQRVGHVRRLSRGCKRLHSGIHHFGGTVTTLRYGIIGSGMMGVEHIENLSHTEGVEVTAIADPDPKPRVRRCACPDALHYTNHEALIADNVCDAVVVASPNFTHVDVLRDLLATDLHVLVEKPLCTTVDDCYTILELAEGRTRSPGSALSTGTCRRSPA